jgi:hypothetical protein
MAVNALGDEIEGSTNPLGDTLVEEPSAPSAPPTPAAPTANDLGDELVTEPAPAPAGRYDAMAEGDSPFAPATPEPTFKISEGVDLSGANEAFAVSNAWDNAALRRKHRDELIHKVGDDELADLLIEREKVTRKMVGLADTKLTSEEKWDNGKEWSQLAREQSVIDSKIRERDAARPSIDTRRKTALAEAMARLSPDSPVKLTLNGGLTVITSQGTPSKEDIQVANDFDAELRRINEMELPAEKRAELARSAAGGSTALSQFVGSVAEQISGVTGMTKRIFGADKKPGDFESEMSEFGSFAKEIAAADTSGLAPVARGVGTVGGLMAGGPGGRMGLFVGALRAGSEAYAEVLDQTGDSAKAFKAAGETVPGMLLFMGAGRVAGGFAASLASESGVAVKTLASFTGATLANVGSSSVLRALGSEPGHAGEAATPTLETLTADTLFAVFHAHGDYAKASTEARMKARAELLARGFRPEDFTAPAEPPEGKTPAEAVIPEDPAVAAERQKEAARRQAVLDEAAKSAEAGDMPMTAAALRAEAAKEGATAAEPPPAAPEPPRVTEPAEPPSRPERPPLSGPIEEIHRPEVDLISRLRAPYEPSKPEQASETSASPAAEPSLPEADRSSATEDKGTGAAPESEVPPLEYEQPERVKNRPPGEREEMVTIKIPEFDEAWAGSESEKTYYLWPDGTNDIAGRRARFEEWLKANPGVPIETPEVHIGPDGTPSFTNGRHRYAVLRDAGERTMKVSMSPESVENARKRGLIVEESEARELTPQEQAEIDAEMEREMREAEEDWRREQEDHRAELEGEVRGMGGAYELLDIIRRIGGLPSLDRDSSLTGETRRLWETSKGRMMRLVSKSQNLSLDQVRQDLEQFGFKFDTADAMLEAIETRMVSGKEVFGFEQGDESSIYSSRKDKGAGTMDLFGWDGTRPEAPAEPGKRAPRPPKSTLEEDRAAVVQAKRAALGKAWTELVEADPWKFPAVSISDLATKAGMTLPETKELLTQLHKEGKIVLSVGDWSLSSEAKRAGVIEIGGQRFLQVRPIGETVFESRTPPEAGSPVGEFRARLLDAAGKAKPEAEWDATGKQPPMIDFERPDRPGSKVAILNTREALTAAAERYRPETNSTHVTRVAEVIEEAKRKVSGVHVVVVRNEGDLPARVRVRLDPRAVHEGIANPGTGTVYIFAGNISTPARALEVFLHEVVGHLGVEKIMKPAEWQALVDSIIKRGSPELDDIARKYTHATDGSELTPAELNGVVAREVIARLAEKPADNPTAWRKVVDAFRRAMRSLGIVKEWSENDIRDLLRRAAKVVEAKPGEAFVGGEDVIRPAVKDLGKEVEDHSPYARDIENALHEALPEEHSRVAVDTYVKGKLNGDDWSIPLSPQERAVAENILRYYQDKQDFAARNGVLDEVSRAVAERTRGKNLDLAERMAIFSAEVNKATAARTAPPEPPKVGEPAPVAHPGESGPTSIKNAVVDKERAARGLPPALEPARRSFGTVWDEAMALIDRDSTVQDRLIAELEENPRAATDTEDALLLHRQIELQNSYDKAASDLLRANEANDAAGVEEAQGRVTDLSTRLLQLYNVGKSVGTATGRGLNARKMMANEDFSLAKMVTEKRVANGGEPLKPEQHAEVVELHQKIADLQKQVAAHEAARAEAESKTAADDAMKAMVEEAERESKAKAPAEKKQSSQAVKKTLDLITKKANEARERIRQRRGTLNVGLNPAELLDYAIVGAEYFAKGAVSIGKFGAKLVLEFGDAVRPHIPEIFAKARQVAAEVRSERDLPAERTAIVEGIKERVGEGDTLQDLGSYVRKLSLNLVRSGVTEREALIDAVHQDLQTIEPGITRREAMDLISGYGDLKKLDPEKAKALLRDLKGQMQQIGKLEDMAAGQAPKKTGVEQREKSDAERKLVAAVNEAKKKGGFTVTDPATQLRSALAARERALTNEIKAVQEEIATGIRRKGSPPPSSPEIEALRTRLADLRAQRDALMPKPGVTDSQRLAVAIRAADRATAEYERQVREKDMGAGKGKPGPTSPELEAAKARRDAARAARDEFRALDAGLRQAKEDARTAQLEASIAELDRRLRTGDTDPVKRKAPLLTPEQEALVSERDEMLKLLAKIRRNPKSDAEKQVERLVKQINDLDARLASGNIGSKGKPAVPPLTPEAARLMGERDARVKALQALRDAAKVRLTPEEIALKRWKSATTNRIADLADRAAKGQWDTPPRMPMKLDAAGQKLAFDLDQAKEAFNRGRFEDMLRRRSLPTKMLGTVGEVINTARAVMTAFDLSAVLRQGGFIAVAHPVRALRAFPAMFRAFGSERGAHAVETEIASRPNADLYRQAKLDLTKRGTKLSDMEEAYMSRWASKIPLVGGSERAYRTFLNRLRADSFDAMVAGFTGRGGATLAEAQAIANFVNVATGRGRLGAKMATAAVGLNHVFFAPRLVLSRFQLLTGQPLWSGSAATRRAIAGEYARYLVGVAVVVALAQAAGADKMETDPRSSNFGKLRWGNTRVDPFSGLLQATVVSSRVITGETKTGKGKISKLRTEPGEKRAFGQDDTGDVIGRFLRSKLSPVAGAGMDIASGRNVVGEPITPGMAATRMFVPMTFNEIYETMKEKGIPAGPAFAVLTIFGAGVQTYDEKAKKK